LVARPSARFGSGPRSGATGGGGRSSSSSSGDRWDRSSGRNASAGGRNPSSSSGDRWDRSSGRSSGSGGRGDSAGGRRFGAAGASGRNSSASGPSARWGRTTGSGGGGTHREGGRRWEQDGRASSGGRGREGGASGGRPSGYRGNTDSGRASGYRGRDQDDRGASRYRRDESDRGTGSYRGRPEGGRASGDRGDRGYRGRAEGDGRPPRPSGTYRGRDQNDRNTGTYRGRDQNDRNTGTYRGRDRRPEGEGPRPVERRQGPPVNRQWGGVARRGAQEVTREGPPEGTSASDIWRQAVARAGDSGGWEPEETWVLEPEEPAEDEPSTRPRAGGQSAGPGAGPAQPDIRPRDLATGREGAPSPGGARRKLPRPVVDELTKVAGSDRGAKLANRIADATYAYEKERYQEARRVLRTLAEEVPESAAVRELYGLVLYRTGQWSAAAKQLEAFREMSGSYDQHPVLADCYRALRRYDEADEVWNDLREASPSGDLVAEGRIVAAGCKADRGDLAGAITMLEKASRKVAKPQERHLRQWYALADLYERAGDVPRARDLFNRVASIDPDAFDVRGRLRALR
jgi:hypothetical protein